MGSVTPDLLADLLDAHADALELFAAQWSLAPADVVQEAFVELARQPEVPQNAKAWLYRVVRNRAISEARSAARRRRRERNVSSAATEAGAWFRAISGAELDPADAAEAIGELADEMREVVVARIWGGLTFEQIGEMSGISAATAFRRFEAAIGLLRTRLGLPCPNQKTSPKI